MVKKYYSNGKLLLTGEYVVLDGALSLAIPTIHGQSLTVNKMDGVQLRWKSMDHEGRVWFEGEFSPEQLKQNPKKLLSPFPKEYGTIAQTLGNILQQAKKLNPSFLNSGFGFEVETQLDFPKNWGLGSSSTLINNIAQWANVNPYELLWKSFSGSGYDIACAQHSHPILYRLHNGRPIVKEVPFDPPFKDCLYFIHLNKKQNTQEGIGQYRTANFDIESVVDQISTVTKKLLAPTDIGAFETLLTTHEQLLSKALKIKTVKETQFPDYEGAIKSLGAWGGDFILAVGDRKTPDYFKSKGFKTIIPYMEMAL